LPISSSKRRHTIVAGTHFENSYNASLEKDWFSYEWISGWAKRHVVTRANHEFHVVSNDADFPLSAAEALVDAALSGKVRVIDLRGFAVSRRLADEYQKSVNDRVDKILSGKRG